MPRKGADIDTSGAGSCPSVRGFRMSQVHGDSHVMPSYLMLVPHIHSERLRVASSHRVDCNCDFLSPLQIPSERWFNWVFNTIWNNSNTVSKDSWNTLKMWFVALPFRLFWKKSISKCSNHSMFQRCFCPGGPASGCVGTASRQRMRQALCGSSSSSTEGAEESGRWTGWNVQKRTSVHSAWHFAWATFSHSSLNQKLYSTNKPVKKTVLIWLIGSIDDQIPCSSQVFRTEDIFAAIHRKDDSSALAIVNLLESETQSLPQALVERLLGQLELLHTEVGSECSMFPIYMLCIVVTQLWW